MKKIGLILGLMFLMLPLSGCSQILGVGNRSTYVPLPTPFTSPTPGTYTSAQSVSFNTLGWLLCYTTDGSVPTASGLYTSSASCTGTSSEYVSGFPFTVSTTTVVHGINFPNQYGHVYTQSAESTSNYVITAGYGWSDSFPYSTGNLTTVAGGNWTNDSTYATAFYVNANSPSIVSISNSSSCSGSAQMCLSRWTGSGGTAPANQSTSVTYAGISSNYGPGPAVRIDTGGANTGYGAICSDVVTGTPYCFIVKVVAGTVTYLTATEGAAVPSTATVKLTVTGTSSTVLTLYVNGSVYQTYTDTSSPITSGTGGIIGTRSDTGDVHITNATGTTP